MLAAMLLTRLSLLCTLSFPLLAQSVEYYGPGSGMVVVGTPRLGTVIDITTFPLGGSADQYTRSNTRGVLMLGIDQISVPFRVGYTVGGSQPAPVATLLTTPLVAVPMQLLTNQGSSWTYQSSLQVEIPNVPALVGSHMTAQWLYHRFLDVQNYIWSNYDYISTSNGAKVTVGS
jgi:hypothetical protein